MVQRRDSQNWKLPYTFPPVRASDARSIAILIAEAGQQSRNLLARGLLLSGDLLHQRST
jgi:hypothetical protein